MNPRECELEFEMSDRVLLKMIYRWSVTKFGVKEILTPRFIGSFKITERN